MFYEATLALTNSSAAVWQSITNLAAAHTSSTTDLVATVTGNAFLQQTPEAFSYDADGNLTQDGRWTYHWDAGNRLIQMVSLTNAPTASKLRLTFGYDSKWRRISKAVEAYTGTTWTTNLAESVVYDGWNLVDELNATNNAVICSYLWGLDLSGTMQGAGGVGGLLAMNEAGSLAGHIVAYAGNGNISVRVDATAGTNTALYEYGPFGEVIRATGPMSKLNPLRFSTQYQDDETDLICYIDDTNADHGAAVFLANSGDMSSAKWRIEQAVTSIGKAQHPVADSTSPPHAGFQVWFGIPDGLGILGPVGYAIFVERHHLRESPGVYNSLGDGPAKTVAGQIHPKLVDVLKE